MSQRLTTLSHAALGLAALSLLGWLLRSAIDPSGTPTRGVAAGPSSVVGAACLVVAGVSFAMSRQWPVRVGGLGMLLGLGLIAELPPIAWLGILLVSSCLLVGVVILGKLSRA